MQAQFLVVGERSKGILALSRFCAVFILTSRRSYVALGHPKLKKIIASPRAFYSPEFAQAQISSLLMKTAIPEIKTDIEFLTIRYCPKNGALQPRFKSCLLMGTEKFLRNRTTSFQFPFRKSYLYNFKNIKFSPAAAIDSIPNPQQFRIFSSFSFTRLHMHGRVAPKGLLCLDLWLTIHVTHVRC